MCRVDLLNDRNLVGYYVDSETRHLYDAFIRWGEDEKRWDIATRIYKNMLAVYNLIPAQYRRIRLF